MEPLTFQGEAFSEYFCTKLLWDDPQLRELLDPEGADKLYKKASSVIRYAQRQLRDREQARSTYTLLLRPLADLLGWQLGDTEKIATEEGLEEGGLSLVFDGDAEPMARAVCIAPDAHLEAAPAGRHRRFAPSLSLARVLKEQSLDYGFVANAFELRLMCCIGTLPSHIGFDLSAIAEGTTAGRETWKLLHNLLRQESLISTPRLLDRVREIGREHQLRVSTDLGAQVQHAVVRFMQGVLDHPENKDKLPDPISDEFLHDLYQETLRLLYRLLFTLYAEDLALLPTDMLTYREGYSLSRLIQLARGKGAESLEMTDPNGSFFQDSLQALFNLLRQGIKLGPEGEIKPYGGALFDPESTKLIDSLKWGNATIDNVLESLSEVPAPKGYHGKVRLSYRELNVEQIGAVYEGLLETAPAYASQRMWKVELDARTRVIDDETRERIREIRGERLASDGLNLIDDPDENDDDEVSDDANGEVEDAVDEDEGTTKKKPSVKKPLKVIAEIPEGTAYLKPGLGRKQTSSYYTNRTFVDFLVRETVDPIVEGKAPKDILSVKILDPAMGSGHFLVGACRRLAEHLLSAYRREVAALQAQDEKDEFTEDDLLVLADIPAELIQVWNGPNQETELAACRLVIAGHCIYGVDKNPLAVDLAKVAMWLVTAASRQPLNFLDHRLQCGDSLLGIPAERVVEPWIAPTPKSKRSSKAKPKKPKPIELVISPPHGQEAFEYYAPSREALCKAFSRAFVRLGELLDCVESDPTNFDLHRAHYGALRGTLDGWWQMHQLRIGVAFEDEEVDPQLLNSWLEDLTQTQRVSDERRADGERIRQRGEEMRAFCWELAFPEVFYLPDGKRRDDAGFTCVIGNPPWDKIKPERDEFYLQYDPLIRQLQGTAKNRRVEEMHIENPAIAAAWEIYESSQKAMAETLRRAGIYAHQTAVVEEEIESDDGSTRVKRTTTGGDPDCFKFFLERAWQLAATGRTVGMVMSSSLHNADGCTGLRRLLLDSCRLRVLCNFDNERKVFPGIHNMQEFDLIVFDKGGRTESFDAAFLTRETEAAVHQFRSHRSHLVLHADDLRRLSPQTRTLFEFRGQRDLSIVSRIYEKTPAFGEQLAMRLSLRFRRELDMGNSSFLFRTRAWLEQNGCLQARGENWHAAQASWYMDHGYIERPIVSSYVLYEGNRVRSHKLPWTVSRSADIQEDDLHDFDIRISLSDGYRLVGKAPDDGLETAFVRPADAQEIDLPAHLPGQKELGPFRVAPALIPEDVYRPLMEGKWIYHLDPNAYAYVAGAGSWVVTRPTAEDEDQQIPHYFVSRADTQTRTPSYDGVKIGFRDVSSAGNERTVVSAPIPSWLACGHKVPVFTSNNASPSEMLVVTAWLASFANDYISRITGGATTLSAMKSRPAPCEALLADDKIVELALAIIHTLPASQHLKQALEGCGSAPRQIEPDEGRACLDAVIAAMVELTPSEYAHILATFPLLDRDQPPLLHDYRIRPTNRGIERRPISFVTRDLALLTYLDYLAGRLDIKPDSDCVKRICPDGAPGAPHDIVEFFSEAGVDIAGDSEYAVAATGPIRDLRERVAKARELGAVAYVPTIDRRRATFVEAAAAQGGLAPEDGVLTADMAKRVLEAKAERDAKMKRAMEFWESTTPVEMSAAIPFPTTATQEADTGTDGGKTKKVQRKRARQANGKKPSKQFEQAVMMTFLVDEIIKVGGTPTRERVQKHLYFAEEVCDLKLGVEFMRKAAGPYAPGMRYKGPEGIAVGQNDWLTLNGHVFDRGKNLAKGLGYAERRVDPFRAALGKLIEHFKTYGPKALGRWATVHFAAKHVAGDGKPVTVETVKAYLAADKEWVNKLQDDAYSDEKIESTLVGLRGFGFLGEEDSPT